jgi:hypothetical protein
MSHKNNILILRTIPIDKFGLFISKFYKINKKNKNNYSILVQTGSKKNIIKTLENRNDIDLNNFTFIEINAKKMNFWKGLSYFSFFKYDKIIVPINSFELEDYSNIFFFILPIFSKKYYFYYPDFSYTYFNYFRFLIQIFLYSFINIIIFIIIIFVLINYCVEKSWVLLKQKVNFKG